MSDIVERLQRKVFRGPTMEASHTKTLEWEAADTITALRDRVKVLEEALQGLLEPFKDDPCRLDHHGYCQTHFIEADCCVSRARAALEAKP
jgi:hypothetical protein